MTVTVALWQTQVGLRRQPVEQLDSGAVLGIKHALNLFSKAIPSKNEIQREDRRHWSLSVFGLFLIVNKYLKSQRSSSYLQFRRLLWASQLQSKEGCHYSTEWQNQGAQSGCSLEPLRSKGKTWVVYTFTLSIITGFSMLISNWGLILEKLNKTLVALNHSRAS